MAEKKMSFEDAMGRLEEIVSSIEQGEAPLEESIKLFTEGTKLLKQCSTMLNKAEQQVTKLVKSSDGVLSEVPFGEEE